MPLRTLNFSFFSYASLRKTNVTFSLTCGFYVLDRYIKSFICDIYGIIYVCEKQSREIKGTNGKEEEKRERKG